MSYEQAIKEARTIEAMKNGYMGLGGKFCSIAKKLGGSIIRQGGMYVDSTEFGDPFYEEDNENIPIMDETEATTDIGLQFDGLSRGINLSIIIKFHLREISVYFEGAFVYHEVSGELEMYVPKKEWEEKIEYLYEITKKIDKENKPVEKEQNEKKKEKEKEKILEKLRKTWGI